MEDNKMKTSGFGIGEVGVEAFSNSEPEQKPTSVRKTGQIWEQCECGEEPVNMPLFLCDNCWPESRGSIQSE